MKIAFKQSLLALMSVGLLTGCGMAFSELSVNEYVAWIENTENGLHTNKAIGEYVFDLQYKPSEYVVIKENMLLPVNSGEMNSETESISGMQYFTLRISREDGLDPLKGNITDPDVYSSRLVYFTSAIQNEIKLIAANDTLPCMLFHYEPTAGIDARATFLLGFEKSEVAGTDRTFMLEARELGTGPILITIDEESINNIPSIKYN